MDCTHLTAQHVLNYTHSVYEKVCGCFRVPGLLTLVIKNLALVSLFPSFWIFFFQFHSGYCGEKNCPIAPLLNPKCFETWMRGVTCLIQVMQSQKTWLRQATMTNGTEWVRARKSAARFVLAHLFPHHEAKLSNWERVLLRTWLSPHIRNKLSGTLRKGQECKDENDVLHGKQRGATADM